MSNMHKLLSATPSPYARKVRITLQEKGIPFELITEVPWLSTSATQTSKYNPLLKLPVLIMPDGREDTAVFESSFILEYLEAKHPQAPIYPKDIDQLLAAKQIDVVASGIMDSCVLWFFEGQREPEKQSKEWAARQHTKVLSGIRWLADKVAKSGADGKTKFLVGDSFGLADIAAGSVLGYSKVRFAKGWDWPAELPQLAAYLAGLETRQSFADTMPAPQTFSEKIV